MEEQYVTYQLDGPIALIGLNRPSKRNAMSTALLADLEAAAFKAAAEARVAVIFGHGKHFCSGRDLVELLETLPHQDPRMRWQPPAFRNISEADIPFVAAMQGAVIGGGLELAAACHLRVAEEDAFFALPEGRRGIFVGGGGSVRIARLMGVARVQDMMLTGRVVSATEAERWNLVQYVVKPGEALGRARELAATIATNSPRSNFATTRGLLHIEDVPQADGLFLERLMGAWVAGPESTQRLSSFVDKTAPPIQPFLEE
jgi:enoyl-CoA hydratase/carnithine racemase